jgi:drug/metabolite transporter (DMT)-like permease
VPVVVALLAPLVARRRPAPHRLVGAAVVVAGGAVVQGAGLTDGTGIALALATMACEVAFTLLAVPVLPRLGPWAVSAWTCLLAAPVLGIAALVADGAHSLPVPTGSQLAMILFLAIGSTMVGFVAWYSAVARIGADLAALVSGGVPVVTLAGGVLLGTGTLSAAGLLGAAIVTAGLLVGLRPSIASPRRRWARALGAAGRTWLDFLERELSGARR